MCSMVRILAEGWRFCHVLSIAGALILSLWDNFITFDQEVTYIWSSPFGLMQAVFFLTRYGNAVTLLYANYCTLQLCSSASSD